MLEILIPAICIESAEKFVHFKFLEGFAYGFSIAVIIALLIVLFKGYFDNKFNEIKKKK